MTRVSQAGGAMLYTAPAVQQISSSPEPALETVDHISDDDWRQEYPLPFEQIDPDLPGAWERSSPDGASATEDADASLFENAQHLTSEDLLLIQKIAAEAQETLAQSSTGSASTSGPDPVPMPPHRMDSEPAASEEAVPEEKAKKDAELFNSVLQVLAAQITGEIDHRCARQKRSTEDFVLASNEIESGRQEPTDFWSYEIPLRTLPHETLLQFRLWYGADGVLKMQMAVKDKDGLVRKTSEIYSYPQETKFTLPGTIAGLCLFWAAAVAKKFLLGFDREAREVTLNTANRMRIKVASQLWNGDWQYPKEKEGWELGKRMGEFLAVGLPEITETITVATPIASPVIDRRGHKRRATKTEKSVAPEKQARLSASDETGAPGITEEQAAKYAAFAQSTAKACAAARAATLKFGEQLLEQLSKSIFAYGGPYELEVLGLENMPPPKAMGKRFRLNFEQNASGISATVDFIDPFNRIEPERRIFETIYGAPEGVLGRRDLYSRFLFRTVRAVKKWLLAPSQRPAVPTNEEAKVEMDAIKARMNVDISSESFIRKMHSFKPVSKNNSLPRKSRDDVSDAPMLLEAWKAICAAHISAALKIDIKQLSTSGVQGIEDQPIPGAADKDCMHFAFRRETDGKIRGRIFINRTGLETKLLGEAVLDKPSRDMQDGTEMSTLVARTGVVAKALLKNRAAPTGVDALKAARQWQWRMSESPDWKLFGDVDLWVAFGDLEPVMEAPAPEPATVPHHSNVPLIIPAGWPAIARLS